MTCDLPALPAVLAPLFCRAFGLLALLPLDQGISGITLKFSLAAGAALFLREAVPVPASLDFWTLPGEFLTGAIIALPALLVISGALMCGEIFDTVRGQSIAELYDPANGIAVSYLGGFFQRGMTLLLLMSGLLEQMLAGLWRSFQVVRAGQARLSNLKECAYALLNFIPAVLEQMLLIFLPVLLVISLIDLAFSFMGKLLPQASLQAEMMLVKTAAGLLVLLCLYRSEILPRLIEAAMPRLNLLSGLLS